MEQHKHKHTIAHDMALLNVLWAIIIFTIWGEGTIGFAFAAPQSGFGLSTRHGNTMMIGSGDVITNGLGTAGGGRVPIPGSVSYQPNDFLDMDKSVYDPGDELLRALNSEAAAELAASRTDELDNEDDYIDRVINDLAVPDKYELLRKLDADIKEEQDIVTKSALLMKLLEDPSIDTLPVVYVEENSNDDNINLPFNTGMEKRSRYYRRYPWKRHSRNRSGSYEPEIRYACTPSKEDIFKLLVGLHENRNGNQHKTVHFCNRKRPAKAIFTNIRFLG